MCRQFAVISSRLIVHPVEIDLTYEGIETRGVREGGRSMVDIIEDIFAFCQVSDGKLKSPSGDDDSCCPACGAELEEDDDGEPYCPDCRE